jgi:medium-chain acyl-[acyl-carrier-protein] hydrolase
MPGREGRLRERPFTSLADLIDAVRQALLQVLERPFALFGHSLGALVAFEFARSVRNAHGLSPVRLFVSARRAPPRREPHSPLYCLPDAALVDEVRRRWNGIPPEVLREPALMEFLLPTLRADLALGETYVYRTEPPLACPISCFGGRDDQTLTPADLAEWRDQTAADFRLQMFQGDHFFLKSAPEALLRALASDLSPHQKASFEPLPGRPTT